jgi:hypothetical protein
MTTIVLCSLNGLEVFGAVRIALSFAVCIGVHTIGLPHVRYQSAAPRDPLQRPGDEGMRQGRQLPVRWRGKLDKLSSAIGVAPAVPQRDHSVWEHEM